MKGCTLGGLLARAGLMSCRTTRVDTRAAAVAQVQTWTVAHSQTNNLLAFDYADVSRQGRRWFVQVPAARCQARLPWFAFRVKARSGKVVQLAVL